MFMCPFGGGEPGFRCLHREIILNARQWQFVTISTYYTTTPIELTTDRIQHAALLLLELEDHAFPLILATRLRT